MDISCYYTYAEIDNSELTQYINAFITKQSIIVPLQIKGEDSILQEELEKFPLLERDNGKNLANTLNRIKKHLKSVTNKIGKNHEYTISISTKTAAIILCNINIIINIEQKVLRDKLIVIQSNRCTTSGSISINFCKSIIETLNISLLLLKELKSLNLEYRFRNKILPHYAEIIKIISKQFYIDTRDSKEKAEDALITTGIDSLGCIIKIIIAFIICYGLSLIFSK